MDGSRQRWLVRRAGWLAASLLLPCVAAPRAHAQNLQCTPEPTDMVIAYGQTVSCAIGVVGDVDTFRFSGVAGEMIRLQAVKQTSSSVPTTCLELFDPSGLTIHTGCGTLATTTRTLSATGTYVVLISEAGQDRTTPYAVAVDRIAPLPPHARVLTLGQTLTDAIEVIGDIDLLRFDGTAGDIVRLQAVKQTSSSAQTVCIEVFDPDALALQQGCGASAVLNMTLTKTGTYAALVFEHGHDQPVPYAVTLESIRQPTPTTRALPYDTSLSDTIEVDGDLDLFMFNGVAGDLIRLQAIKQTSSSVPTVCVELFDPQATLVHAGCGAGAVATLTPASTGTFFVLVSEAGQDATLPYAVSVICISGTCPPPPAPPAPTTFRITGRVRDQNDSPVAGVALHLAGQSVATATTQADGTYMFSGLAAGGSFTITPMRPLYTFLPASQTFPTLTQDTEAAPFTVAGGVFTRYFAEGVTGAFFTTEIALLNATGTPADTRLLFTRPDGVTVEVPLSLAALDRRTVDPATFAGLADTALSTVVESTQPVIADRTMRWDSRGYGSHTETSIAAPLTSWYLAEGATIGGFQTFYLLQNPNPDDAVVEISYLRPAPEPPLVKSYTVAANSRFTIWTNVEEFETPVGPEPLLASEEFAAAITSTLPVIVERAMYLNRPGQTFDAGHESAASPELSTAWFLAEGATGPYFDLFALIVNPNAETADLEVTYLLPDSSFIKTYTVPGRSRFNIWADVDDPRLADTAVSMALRSTNGVPILVERAMWWPGTSATWFEGHNSRGAIDTGEKWGVAHGEVGGPLGLETYVLVANTSSFDANVQVTVVFDDGTTASQSYAVGASSRFNVPMGAFFPSTNGRRFGVVVESMATTSGTARIVVERASYNDATIGGQTVRWAAGGNAFGTRLR